MSDCAYGSNSTLDQWGSVKMSGCAYGSSSPVGQFMSISKAFLLLVRVRLANKSRLILVGAAVSFVRVFSLSNGTAAPISTARHFDRTPLTQRTVAAVGTVRHVDIRPRRLITLTTNNKETSL